MSARMEIEELSWKRSNSRSGSCQGPKPSEVEIANLTSDLDSRDLIAPLRQNKAAEGFWSTSQETEEQKRRVALKTQDRWNAWLTQRDQLRTELKRGRECLDQVDAEILETRAQLEEWARFERICGRNPLCDYMQTLSAKESIRQFLPDWLERREKQLTDLELEMEVFARKNGLEQGFES